MDYFLLGVKHLPNPKLDKWSGHYQLHIKEHILVKFELEYIKHSSKKMR